MLDSFLIDNLSIEIYENQFFKLEEAFGQRGSLGPLDL